jgi:hypothetical protein
MERSNGKQNSKRSGKAVERKIHERTALLYPRRICEETGKTTSGSRASQEITNTAEHLKEREESTLPFLNLMYL